MARLTNFSKAIIIFFLGGVALSLLGGNITTLYQTIGILVALGVGILIWGMTSVANHNAKVKVHNDGINQRKITRYQAEYDSLTDSLAITTNERTLDRLLDRRDKIAIELEKLGVVIPVFIE